ncbi:MAG TPA: COQ9 family protein [Acetobacteraceae bacterium]|nr:COQ9 family protein [Acetobacteraceae bacterium]
MMAAPERSPERDAAIEAMLPRVAQTGWTMSTLLAAAGPDADLLFPGGARDMIEAYFDWADRRMEAEAAAMDMSGLRLPARVRAVLAIRFAQNRPYKDAVRRALGVLAAPGNGALAARCTARTVDAIWHAAGDSSADFSWYTKRASLAAVYAATLLYWLRDDSFEDEATLAFLDRRLAGIGRIGRWRKRGEAVLQRCRKRPEEAQPPA